MGQTQSARPRSWVLIQGGQVSPSMSRTALDTGHKLRFPGLPGLVAQFPGGEPRTLCFSHGSQMVLMVGEV